MEEATSNPLDTILAAITSSQRETRELRAELRAAQEEAAERAARKSEKPYHFQKKAHEDQAFFNESVMDHILEAESQLSRAARLVADGPAKVALEKAKQSLKLGKDALSHSRRLLAQPKVRKEPVTAEMLKAMVVAAGPEPSLSEVRLLAICLVGFAGFMRCEELLKLECADVKFKEEGMVLSIRSSKTDQVFRAIVNSKGGETLRKSGGLSYSRLRELLLAKIAMLGMDPLQFGMHSLRAGGATAAANAEVPDRLFKRHGRWRSESAKDGYVKDSAGSRLSVSKSLGI
ncbi:hypothetical protein EMCRGX_G002533 [Ephydatia muelleri]